jgi:hypothetical protein
MGLMGTSSFVVVAVSTKDIGFVACSSDAFEQASLLFVVVSSDVGCAEDVFSLTVASYAQDVFAPDIIITSKAFAKSIA